MIQITFGINLEIECCCNCHMHFAMPAELIAKLRISGGSFYCPSGHSQHYTAKSAVDKERDRTNAVQAQLNEANHARLVAEKKLAEERAERMRVEKRIHRGVCPCCNRSFKDLAAHMKTKHPNQIAGNPKASIKASL